MKRIKKLLAVCTFCLMTSISMNVSVKSFSEVFAGIAYAGNVNRDQGIMISAADTACQACLYFALAGSGATAGASLVIGLCVSA